jgi:hypothetical protein
MGGPVNVGNYVSSSLDPSKSVAEQLAAIGRVYGTRAIYDKPVLVRRRRRLLGLIPVSTFDSLLWIGLHDHVWRVIVSEVKSSDAFIGADFNSYSCLLEAWVWHGKHWRPAPEERVPDICKRVTESVAHAYRQCCKAA